MEKNVIYLKECDFLTVRVLSISHPFGLTKDRVEAVFVSISMHMDHDGFPISARTSNWKNTGFVPNLRNFFFRTGTPAHVKFTPEKNG